MSQAWYRVASMSYGYAGAAILLLILLLSLRKHFADRALWRRVGRDVPQVGAAGALRVVNAGRAHLSNGEEIPVPYEGTLGSAHSCDLRIPKRRVHMRSAFFWVERGELHLAALHRDGFEVDGVEIEPGDEAVLRDGAALTIGDLKLSLKLSRAAALAEREGDEPYVTAARRSRAQQGRGEGIGAPGKGEARREKRLNERQRRGERAAKGGGKAARAEKNAPAKAAARPKRKAAEPEKKRARAASGKDTGKDTGKDAVGTKKRRR